MPCLISLPLDEELFTISSWTLHLRRIHREQVKKGVTTIMVSFIEVFILAAIFGILYAMLQFAKG